jgi:1,4-alpha-glucan branching enzyme
MNEPAKKDVGAVLRGESATFRVWAPFAKSVAVAGSFNNWAHATLNSENDGYWAAEINGVVAGQEYKFVINDGSKDIFKNDPRSLSVTTSMGSSVIVDTNFDWEEDRFEPPAFNKQVIYELHIGTFNRPDPAESGTFDTATAKLGHLAEMGVNMIELMPISTMMEDRGWGYATNYIYSIESLYGGRKQFLEFVKKAHQKGIGVILDVVYNHFGPGGGLDLWQFDGWNQDGHGGIYFYNDWRSDTPWGATRPDFGRLEVREYICDNVRMWMRDCHLDGLRVDSTIYIRNVKGHNDDPSSDLPDGWSILQDINTLCKEIKPAAITSFITKPSTEGGAGFAAQWAVGFPHAMRSALDATDDVNRNISEVSSHISQKYNNDVFQRVVYSDSHDSASNGGARLNEEISPGEPESIYARKRSLIAAGIVLTAPGVPMLLQGQEFMQGGSFNDWQALDWKKVKEFSGIVLAHKHLISLRKNEFDNSKGLTGQSLNILHLNEQNKVLAYHRWENGGVGDDVIVVINFTNRKQDDYVINFPRKGTWKVRFNSSWKGYSSDFEELGVSETIVEKDNGKINLPSYSVLILSQDS